MMSSEKSIEQEIKKLRAHAQLLLDGLCKIESMYVPKKPKKKKRGLTEEEIADLLARRRKNIPPPPGGWKQ